MTGITALVLAGSRPGRDSFAAMHGTDVKALIPVMGKPMVRRPVEALLASDRIAEVRVLSQRPERIREALPAHSKLSVHASEATIAATLEELCFDTAVHWPLLVTTADHALLDAAMIEEFCGAAQGVDLAIGMVERRALEQRLPQVQRTWIRFRGGAWSGANLFMLGSRKVIPALELWRSVEQDRKKVATLLWALGPVTFLAAMLRLRTLDQVLRRIGGRLGMAIRAVELSNPLAAVDVDKPSDHTLVELILEGRA